MRPALHWTRSLRFRLLAATLVALLIAVALAAVLLTGLFRDHVLRQFGTGLVAQLDQVTAQLEFDATGRPQLDGRALSDPRWSRPYSGLYWQLDGPVDAQAAEATTASARGLLRSRSLWDATLLAPADRLDDGVVHRHEVVGPEGAALLLVERTVRSPDTGATRWRLLVAADLRETAAAVAAFTRVLLASLVVLLLLLSAAAVAQVGVGLAPLKALQQALTTVHQGRSQRLEGRFPAEVQPLIDDFNAVLARNAEVVARARTQAGNLAHAIKTPLATLAQAAASAQQGPQAAAGLATLVQEQVATARRLVDWHLARSRTAASRGVPGARVALQPVVAGLLRVMEQVHAERHLRLACAPIAAQLVFAGEIQDLQEALGNVIDNACKWARHEVHIAAEAADTARGRRLHIVIDDDGPGIDPDRRDAVMARGTRLDESVPGTGLGLAIAHELVDLYGGRLTLGSAAIGGLRVEVDLPAG
jgi:signal transduction histidine kinase